MHFDISISADDAHGNNRAFEFSLLALISEQDDEVLFAIAEELGMIFSLLPDKCAFLPLLEILASSDETVVREQATASLTTICETLNDEEI